MIFLPWQERYYKRMKEKIWLSSPHLTGEEQKYVKEAFDDN